jgi:hypothetical protein
MLGSRCFVSRKSFAQDCRTAKSSVLFHFFDCVLIALYCVFSVVLVRTVLRLFVHFAFSLISCYGLGFRAFCTVLKYELLLY